MMIFMELLLAREAYGSKELFHITLDCCPSFSFSSCSMFVFIQHNPTIDKYQES
jgi:hypothetical protein